MSLQYSLPFGKKDGVKNYVFTLLSHEYPLKLIELTQFIRKRYGRVVTFQAVRKAVLELVREGVVVKKKVSFELNKEWVYAAKKNLDELYGRLSEGKESSKKFDSIGEEISVFTFDSLGSLMKFWEDLIEEWVKKIDRWEPNANCYQAAHAWEALLYPESERKIMARLIKKGISSHTLIMGKTPLDKLICRFYRDIGVQVAFSSSTSSFDKEYVVGTYGELVVQTRLPVKIVDALETFFKRARRLEDLDLKKLTEIIHSKAEVKLSVTKNGSMAKQINHSIRSQM